MNCMKTWPFIAFNVMSSVWRDDSHISPGVLLICALCRRLWEGFNFLIALTTFSIWPTVLCCSLSRLPLCHSPYRSVQIVVNCRNHKQKLWQRKKDEKKSMDNNNKSHKRKFSECLKKRAKESARKSAANK